MLVLARFVSVSSSCLVMVCVCGWIVWIVCGLKCGSSRWWVLVWNGGLLVIGGAMNSAVFGGGVKTFIWRDEKCLGLWVMVIMSL